MRALEGRWASASTLVVARSKVGAAEAGEAEDGAPGSAIDGRSSKVTEGPRGIEGKGREGAEAIRGDRATIRDTSGKGLLTALTA